MDLQAVAEPVDVCDHCGLEAFYPVHENDKVFCCHGCSQVHQLLLANGLENFYQIKKEGVAFAPSSPVNLSPDEEYFYLDQIEFFDSYGKTHKDGSKSFSFYIEGVNCLACIWLLEKLPDLNQEILESQFDLSRSQLNVKFNNIKLSELAQLISNMGYKAHPLKNEEEQKIQQQRENRKELIRLAVSGMLAGNIMLFAVSLYGGAHGIWGKIFEWGSALLALPVLTYGAFPFYRNFLRDIKLRKISLDTPIVLSLFLGSGIGVYHLAQGNPHHYFDSLTTLVFLLLASRYFLRVVKQKGLQLNHLTDYFLQSWTRAWSSSQGKFEEVHLDQLRTGQRILVEPGEIIPVDGIILKGSSSLNTALITGEFAPQRFKEGQRVYSGSEVLDVPLEVEVEKVGRNSRLGEILEEVKGEWNHRNPITRLTDKLARYLVTVVLVLAIVLFSILVMGDLDTATNRTLALIIIACPCALGLATPLAMVLGMKVAASQGIIIKSDESLEKVAKINEIFLDKTGTLTHGRFQVTNWENEDDLQRSIVYGLEKKSKHPIARSLVQYIQSKGYKELQIDKVVENIGRGIEGWYQVDQWEVRSIESNMSIGKTQVGVFKNNTCVSQISLEDSLREDALSNIEKLNSIGIKTNILSGDNESAVKKVGDKLELPEQNLFYNASPEAKKQILKTHPNAMMVGDGANDTLAFSQAAAGVAVKGSMSLSLKVSDAYLTTPGIIGVTKLVLIAKETMKVVKRNIIFSLIYNVVGVTAACLGYVDPLWAAVFMPLSSITVVSSTLWGTSALRKIKKGQV